MSQEQYFRVNAGIKNIIGKELIYSDHVAIIELIKNSKDAGASKAIIKFIEEEYLTNKSSIIIADDGKGMTLEELQSKWLNIAYSEKKESAEIYAGSKGVGRFSCDRLGEKLDLYTKNDNGEYIHLSVDWADFENKGIDDEISKIPVKLTTLGKTDFCSITKNFFQGTGTLLKIEQLRDSWQTSKMRKLITELEKFSPNLNKGFFVELYSENKTLQDKVNTRINNNIFERLEFKSTYIKSRIDADGQRISTELFFQSELVYQYNVKNPYPLLKNIEVEIHYLDTLAKKYFTQYIGGIPAVEYGSIFLFYNNFRISPYGNRRNDWLGIDQRKTQGTNRNFGTRDLLGKVIIHDTDSSFNVLSNREGLANTPAFHQLIAYDHREQVQLELEDGKIKEDSGYLISILRQLESFVVEGVSWNKFVDTYEPDSKKVITADIILKEPMRYQLQKISSAIVETVTKKLLKSSWGISEESLIINIETLKKVHIIAQKKYDDFLDDFSETLDNKKLKDLSHYQQKKVIKIIEEEQEKTKRAQEDRDIAQKNHARAEKKAYEATKKIEVQEKTIEQITSQNLFLKVTSNQETDNLLLSMHSILNNTATIDASLQNIRKTEDINLPDSIVRALETIAQVNQKTFSIAKFATLYNFNDKTKKIYADINTFINSYLNELSSWTMHSKIKIINNLNLKFQSNIKFVPLDIMMLIDNIITNSKKAKSTELFISNDINGDKIIYKFKDNGIGITDKYLLSDLNLVFEKGVTTTKGSGLGLFHVAKTVNKLNGHVDVLSFNDGFELGVYLPCS